MSIPRSYLILLAVLGLSSTAACTEPAEDRPMPGFDDFGKSHTVTVEQRDVTSVVTVEAAVTASPGFVVTAPQNGKVIYTGKTRGAIAGLSRGEKSQTVTLPANAVLRRRLVTGGANVPAGLPIAEASYTGFALTATIPTTTLYRFYGALGPVRAQIDQGPGPFDCPLLGAVAPPVAGTDVEQSAPAGAPPSAEGDDARAVAGDGAVGSRLLCAPPADLPLLVGSRAIIAVTTGTAHNALTLPVEAVAGLVNRGTVLVDLGNGRTESRNVGLGITDGTVVQITSGLATGDRIVTPAPDLGPR